MKKCDEALASPLLHTAFTSSSVFSSGYAPGYAKLNRRGGVLLCTLVRPQNRIMTEGTSQQDQARRLEREFK
ncbi:hypothetical protein AMECASPLE_010137 [Ameca splendens]|uniref:Uncharacterized protein n=1 Tax=Ameca splendens TaxID=208324 RepID=A0ABV0Z994_9TELE